MNTKDHALDLALEALSTAHLVVEDDMLADEIANAITAIKKARSAPYVASPRVQEPVAWVEKNGDLVWQNYEAAIGRNLYTTPPSASTQKQLEELSSENIRLQNLNNDLENWVATLKERISYMKAYPQNFEREWQGLTDDEYKQLHLQMGPVYYYQDYGHAIEAKLKERNT